MDSEQPVTNFGEWKVKAATTGDGLSCLAVFSASMFPVMEQTSGEIVRKLQSKLYSIPVV
jgi:hypothetical protein